MAHVLIVDDNAVNRAVCAAMLKSRGHDAIEAASGAEALRKLEGGGIDLVVLDIDMPEMNGGEVLKRIRSHPALAPLPVLAHTAIANPGDEDYFIAQGFDGLACKPVEPRVLLALCDRLLASRAAA